MCTRGAESPRSASPIGPAPTRLPRMALPLAIYVSCQLTKRASMPSPMMDVAQTRATATVKRSRLRSATDDPPSDVDMPPPNMSDRPPPLPLCSRMNKVRTRLDSTSRTCSTMRTASTWSLQIVGVPGVGGAGRPLPHMFPGLGQGYLPEGPTAEPTRRSPSGRRGRSGGGEVVAVATDRRELGRVDGSAAHEGAVDVLLGHDRRHVVRLDAAAVEDPDTVGDVAAVELGEQRADRRTHLLRVVGGRALAGAERPDGLVGDDDRRGLFLGHAVEVLAQLRDDVLDLTALLAHVEPLAAAEDRRQAVGVCRLDLRVDHRVGLCVPFASLAVSPGDVGAPELGQEGARDVAGVGAVRVRRQVLRTVLQVELVTLDEGLDRSQVGEGWEHCDLDGRVVVLGVAQRPVELLHEVRRLEVVEVHLPVAGHERHAPDRLGVLRHQASPSSSTVSPGSSLPSRYSRLAPPPVEMWPNWSSSKPSWRTAAAESPPPTTVSAPRPVMSTSDSASAWVPAA